MAHPLYVEAHRRKPQSASAERMEQYERCTESEGTHTARELRFAYECACDPENFRGPFTTTVSPDLLPALTRAVKYFTGGNLEVLGTDHQSGRLVVRSAGQR